MTKPPDPELETALAAIADGPADDARRRVLADLLQERGDPRGEFLLLQFLVSENQASGAMRQRAENLWRSNKRKWLEGVDKVLTDLKLERGFPVEAAIAPTCTSELLAAALPSPMFSTLERLSGRLAGAMLVEALASPRLRVLRDVTFHEREAFTAAAERAVPHRLTRVELRFEPRDSDFTLLLESPVFAKLQRLAFQPTNANAPRRRSARDVVARLAGTPEPLIVALERLSTHPTLRHVSLLGHAFGDVQYFASIARAWPKLKFTALSASGSFELTRESDGTHVMLQNMTKAELLRLRPMMPIGTVRVAMMPRAERAYWEAPPREELLKAYASLDPRVLP